MKAGSSIRRFTQAVLKIGFPYKKNERPVKPFAKIGFAGLLAVMLSQGIQAQTRPHIRAIAGRLPHKIDSSLLGYSAYAPFGGRANTIASAIPAPIDAGEDSLALTIYFVLYDTLQDSIVRAFSQRKSWGSQYSLHSISIDTAEYLLKAGLPACGLRIGIATNSRISPVSETSLSLLAIGQGRIEAVLTDFLVADQWGDWDGSCQGSFHEMKVSIRCSRPKKGSYSRIIADYQWIETSSTAKGESCIDKTGKRRSRAVLHFQNGSYKIKHAD